MNKKGWVGIFLVFLFLFIFMGFLIFKQMGVVPSKSAYSVETSPEVQSNSNPIAQVKVPCVKDSDCSDDSLCTINLCRDGYCTSRDVVLCYQNDGCCPKGCNPTNDNDCVN